jgi:hypothetical protein
MSDYKFNHISYFVKDAENIDMTPDYVKEIKKALERHRRIKAKEDKEPLEVLRKGMDQLKLEDEIAMDPIECLKEWLEEVGKRRGSERRVPLVALSKEPL